MRSVFATSHLARGLGSIPAPVLATELLFYAAAICQLPGAAFRVGVIPVFFGLAV